MNVVLIGYRGTGKSTVGRLVADRLGQTFVDADEELERRAGRTIREIFSTDGESGFRELEASLVGELLKHDQIVVALGGGAVLREDNRRAIKSAQNRVIWLQASAEALLKRIESDQSTAERRPNLTPVGGLAEIVRLLALREPLYRECADFVVGTEGKTPDEIAAEVVSLLAN